MSQTVAVVQTPTMLGRVDGSNNFATLTFPVHNGVTVANGDFVYFDGAGAVTNASIATQRLLGMSMSPSTVGNAGLTNTVVVCIDPLMQYIIKASANLAASNVGQYFDLQGSSGAYVVNQASAGTDNPFLCIAVQPAYGPQGTDSLLYGVFIHVNSPLFPKSA